MGGEREIGGRGRVGEKIGGRGRGRRRILTFVKPTFLLHTKNILSSLAYRG